MNVEAEVRVKCRYCGELVKPEAIKCKHCQTFLVKQESAEKGNMMTPGWIIVSILFPLVGVFAGIWGLIKKRDGAGALLGVTAIAWLAWIVLFF